MVTGIIIALVIAGVVIAVLGSKKKSKPAPVVPVELGPSRPGILYGYFGCYGNQVSEVKEHTNVHMEMLWEGWTKGIENCTLADKPIILNIQPQCFTDPNLGNVKYNSHGMIELRVLLNRFKSAGLLGKIIALYPVDEPDLCNISVSDLTQMANDVREVISEFPELLGCKLAVFYTGREDYRGIELFDWVGFDDYGNDNSYLNDGKYQRFRNKLNDSQRIMLIPGGCAPWHTNPAQFYIRAQEDTKVIAIIPFIWIDNYGNSTELGIRSNPNEYVKIGKLITEKPA